MTTLENAARMALEALEKTGIEGTGEMHDAAIAALRQALEQPKREWRGLTPNERWNLWDPIAVEAKLKEKNA